MPRPARRQRQRREDYGPDHLRALTRGHGFFPDTFPGDEGKKEAWEELRDEIMADWIRTKPGTRPHAWWLYEAPEPRRCLNMPHPFESAGRTAFLGVQAHALSFGKPRCLVTPNSAPGCPDDFAAVYESERAFLERLGLLLPGE